MSEKNDQKGDGLSRRDVLVGTGGVAALTAMPATAATKSSTGRRFKAYVVDGDQPAVRELTLLPIPPRGVVIRTEASAPCYTMVLEGLRGASKSTAGVLQSGELYVLGHSAVGIVEEVGSLVGTVQVGDRVMVSTANCGLCYHCLTGTAHFCAMMHQTGTPIATLDGRPVSARAGVGGLSELTVVTEEVCIPIWSDLPAAELVLLADTGGVGLAATFVQSPVEPGTDVVVQGCGPVGLSAVQGARIKGATQIIAIEPIAERRAMALKLGATHVLDPNREGDGLVERVRDMCKGPTDRPLAGGRAWAADKNFPLGADYSFEAAGGDKLPPKRERSPDPTGILPVQQAWEYTRSGGHVTCMGIGQPGNLALNIPAWQFINRGRTLHSGQLGGLQARRDLPRMIRLMERGLYDARSMITRTYSLAETRQAFQDTADRTIVAGIVTFS